MYAIGPFFAKAAKSAADRAGGERHKLGGGYDRYNP
jgi:hypothetical protein